ncbi:DUF484 family protein [Pokkaliibacter sp. CJK22405]|uniref:GGDEF domain-containing protein n=1 Tax=Pokkaliibacter sp. CJK22405 TaxID=3384615 RepID=UPI003984E8A7
MTNNPDTPVFLAAAIGRMAEYSSARDEPSTDASLERRYRDLLDDAHRFEKSLRQFRSAELLLLRASTLVDVIRTLLGQMPRLFELDEARLYLVDADGRLSDFLGPEKALLCQSGLACYHTRRPLETLFSNSVEVSLETELTLDDSPIRSRAILPLRRHNQLLGILSFGSLDPERFRPEYGLDLLEHFASVVSVCFENSLTHEELRLLSLRDPLTKLWNRRYLDESLNTACRRLCDSPAPLTLMLVDIDHFKKINDSFGHPIGDKALVQLARLLRRASQERGTLARYGGEEFAILFPNCDATEAARLAEKFRRLCAQTPLKVATGKTHTMTLSIGVKTWLPDNDPPISADQLLEAADKALYQAKQRGRNRVVMVAQSRASVMAHQQNRPVHSKPAREKRPAQTLSLPSLFE